MAITVTLPVSAPTGLSATLQNGGSLDASTTYYYVVIAYETDYYSPSNSSRFGNHSPISAEDSFTTDATNKSAQITWTNVSGATNYNILITKTSGDYVSVKAYGTANETVGTITDGTTGFLVDDEGDGTHIIHTCQLTNDLAGGLDKDTGIIRVAFSGTGTENLEDVYSAVVSAGFSDNIFYDGYYFVLKGWLYCSSSVTDIGYLVVEGKSLVFIKGGVHNQSSNYTFRFGRWLDNDRGAEYNYACKIDICHSRYPFRGYVSNNLQVYGCTLTQTRAVIRTLSEPLSDSYYYDGSQQSITAYIGSINDSFPGYGFRSNSDGPKDIKMKQVNNFGNAPHIRCNIIVPKTLPYTTVGKFYNCSWAVNNTTINSQKMLVYGPPYADLHTDYYDCYWPTTTDNIPYFRFTNLSLLYDECNMSLHYSLNIKVIDADGDPISGVDVSLMDQSDDPGVWVEHDTTIDKEVTGNTYTTARTTDVNGEINTYYVTSYHVELNPDVSIQSTYNDDIIITNYYPLTITLSKSGYPDYSIILDTLLESTDLLIKYIPGTLPDKPEFKFITHKKIAGV